MRTKSVFVILAFLLLTGPGALDAWLSLLDRFAGEDGRVAVNWGTWYEALFPLLGFVILLFGIWWTRSKHQESSHKTDQTTKFYENRNSLSSERPLKVILQEVNTAWASWNTGTYASIIQAFELGKIKRLVLPHPHNGHVKLLAASVNKKGDALVNDIITTTEEAITAGVAVRWHKELPSNTLLIGNPNSADAWVQVELLQPFTSADARPSFVIYMKDHKAAFESFVHAFEKLWEQSEPCLTTIGERARAKARIQIYYEGHEITRKRDTTPGAEVFGHPFLIMLSVRISIYSDFPAEFKNVVLFLGDVPLSPIEEISDTVSQGVPVGATSTFNIPADLARDKRGAYISIDANGRSWHSEGFTIDFNQQPMSHKSDSQT